MNKTLPAKLSICRFQSGLGNDGISLRVTDKASNSTILEIDMSVETFAHAMFITEQECEAHWRTKNLGLKHEWKKEVVPYEHGQDKKKALAPFEIDGWIGTERDLDNGHRSVKGGQEVHFDRWVKE